MNTHRDERDLGRSTPSTAASQRRVNTLLGFKQKERDPEEKSAGANNFPDLTEADAREIAPEAFAISTIIKYEKRETIFDTEIE